ncbi:twin-arginine translocase subunit TatC [Schaalia sp. lx-100]|uniref:twin-arginine translocase subunit TatC n=1 Tax=Schaalia sp. lx-100 TaxID=2899081 RepID=UPI001E545113|nr:twin-arginine translocase subunit TatC [Schaalia sp. lx-100]MCD4556813.1 twin-arginine translocase subunit TatC [Schaalia sp. lx-100]
MPLTEHLLELRKRILLSLMGIALIAIAGWCIYPLLLEMLVKPLDEIFAAQTQPIHHDGVNFRTVLSPLTLRLSVSAWIGLIGASPWWLAQVWFFIAPALERHHRRLIIALTCASVILFSGGAMLGWFFFPRLLGILLSEIPERAGSLLDIDSYITFVITLTVVMGISALFPLVIIGLHALHIVSVRGYIRGWRWAVMGAFTFAAITNPLPDIWSMIVQSLALLGLYYCAVGICATRMWWAQRGRLLFSALTKKLRQFGER